VPSERPQASNFAQHGRFDVAGGPSGELGTQVERGLALAGASGGGLCFSYPRDVRVLAAHFVIEVSVPSENSNMLGPSIAEPKHVLFQPVFDS